jgi:hypothetical protein
MRSWEQISKVLLALSPVLATEGHAAFEGQDFVLEGDFGDTREKKISKILESIPYNVVSFFKDDLFSNKIGPLLFDQFANETSHILRLELILLIIYEKPNNWKIQVQKYISSVSKNSFYLFKVVDALSVVYQYSYSSQATLKEIALLIKMCYAMREFGDVYKMNKISNDAIPNRVVEDDENKGN